MRNLPKGAAIYGIDLGKTTFHVVGIDSQGAIIQKAKFTRASLLSFFSKAAPAKVGMEACPGSQWLARKLIGLGHSVSIIPAQYVKPYVKSNKNDLIDAAAIAEAMTRPTMRFVQVKNTSQVDLQALHRIRENLVQSRTRVICQIRAFCLEYGISMRHGVGTFKADTLQILAEETNDLTPMMRQILLDQWQDFKYLDNRLAEVSLQIQRQAEADETAMRLTTIPGIGNLTATAITAAVGHGQQFKKARDLSAWLGLVPSQNSTGGKTQLGSISKRGNPYVRKLLIHGARAVLLHLDRSKHRLGRWIQELETRLPRNKVVVAIANKLARIAWAVMQKSGNLYLPAKMMAT
jgi:transposase